MNEASGKKTTSTMDDIARELNLSKSTVSRAISGKGRMKDETRQRILDYIAQRNYRPSSIAKSLAQNKTYNIGFTIPKDYSMIDVAFFQHCLYGVTAYASERNYDVVTTVVMEEDYTQLKRLVEKRKVDAIIVGRSWDNHKIENYLQNNDMPFLIFGLTELEDVCQIYQNHEKAGYLLMDAMLKEKYRVALIGGDSKNKINIDRLNGVYRALSEHHMKREDIYICLDCYSDEAIQGALDMVMKTDADCILCMDDYVGISVFEYLADHKISIPNQMKVASMYKSDLFAYHQPAVTTIEFNAEEIGRLACETIFEVMNGKAPNIVMQDCTLSLRESTNSIGRNIVPCEEDK